MRRFPPVLCDNHRKFVAIKYISVEFQHSILGILFIEVLNKTETSRLPRCMVDWQVDILYAPDLLKNRTDLFGRCLIAQVAHEEGAAAVRHGADTRRSTAKSIHWMGSHEDALNFEVHLQAAQADCCKSGVLHA